MARCSRVLVIGICGAGKSTFSRRLAAELGLPLIELDRHHWRPGWREMPRQEWRERVSQLAAGNCWVMDGNYTGSLDVRLPRAEAVVWLDYPRSRALGRVLKRVWRDYGRTRDGMADGCPERFDVGFLRYVWSFPDRVSPRIEAALCRLAPNVELHRIGNDAAWPNVIAAMAG